MKLNQSVGIYFIKINDLLRVVFFNKIIKNKKLSYFNVLFDNDKNYW